MREPYDPRSPEEEREDCIICTENLPVYRFTAQRTTEDCNHEPRCCFECIQNFIHAMLESRVWTDIRCPECQSNFTYNDFRRLARPDDFARIDNLSSTAALSALPEFRWCLAGCGSGQLHGDEATNPRMECVNCHARQCYTHNVAWHNGMTCDEYDQFIANPETFRSRQDIENERAAAGRAPERESQADGEWAREREERQRRTLEESERAPTQREDMIRRQREENESTNVITQTTKPCPNCQWRIEKIDGCDHMRSTAPLSLLGL
ncbi:hypothetical protein F5X68DRAFT_241842 [Plectosphaerella plurivora]|uniref:RBR-type E3 ubiquitin transferase n=1 Tax=Plectosphaerella plurivora TaxID=936078 RepID=A0A9P8V8M0_9PEZI|nr:hypothetical protein F5X68DRAFT_241842 [Plectosphaerella plurivora]